MHDHLRDAIAFAESVRYSGDLGQAMDRARSLQSSDVHYQFNENGLRVSDDLTPGLYEILMGVCDRLKINPDDILAYVYASADIQACCYSADTRDCLISMSSGLVTLMSDEELAFVIGHELGHFLLGHGADVHADSSSAESLMGLRAKEISADRIGLLACPSKEAAYRALIKTTAGLDESYLRFDVSTFLEQIQASSTGGTHGATASTHPSLVLRCRALLWFEMSKPFNAQMGRSAGEKMSRVNDRVGNDLARFVDGPAQQQIADAEESLHIWMMTAAAIRDGAFAKEEQELIADEFGQEYLEKIVSMFSECSKPEVESIVRHKLADSIGYFQSVAPQRYMQVRPNIETKLASKFAQDDVATYLNSLVGN